MEGQETVIDPVEAIVTIGVRTPEILISVALSCINHPDAKLLVLPEEPPYPDYYDGDPTKVILYVKEQSIGNLDIFYNIINTCGICQDAEMLLNMGNWICNNIHPSVGFIELVSMTESLIRICYKMKGMN